MSVHSIHTFEIRQQLTWLSKQGIVQDLYKESAQKGFHIYSRGSRVQCSKYQNVGVLLSLHTENHNNYLRHYLSLRVNPRLLIGERSYVGLFALEEEKIKCLISQLNQILIEIGYSPNRNDLGGFFFHRLDLCTNLQVFTPVLCDYYIKLSKRADVPPMFRIKTTYDLQSKRQKAYRNAHILYSPSLEVTLYNKQRQMESDSFFSAEDIAEANGILRFEISLKSNALVKYYQQEKNFEEFLLYGNLMSRKLLSKYTKKIFRCGDYYSLEEGRKRIQTSRYNAKNKAALMLFLEYSARHKQLPEAIAQFRKDSALTERQFSKILSRFDELNLNPVSIPRRWGLSYLPGLHSLLARQVLDDANQQFDYGTSQPK